MNLEELFEKLLPKNRINRIHYFTARVSARPNAPDTAVKQGSYLRALGTLPKVSVHYGTFLASPVRAPVLVCDASGYPVRKNNELVVKTAQSGKPVMEWFYKSEEKGSDVNLAAQLLRDAFTGDCRCAVIVSNDSDLLTPIRIAKDDCGLVIGLVPPRAKGSAELKKLAHFQKSLRVHELVAAQFPTQFQDKSGTITKPTTW